MCKAMLAGPGSFPGSTFHPAGVPMMHVMRILFASILVLFWGGTMSIVIGLMIWFMWKMVSTP